MIDADLINSEFAYAADRAEWDPLPPREPGDDFDDLRPERNGHSRNGFGVAAEQGQEALARDAGGVPVTLGCAERREPFEATDVMRASFDQALRDRASFGRLIDAKEQVEQLE